MTNEFNGKVALVTGASAGIGAATAIAFAKAGAKVVVASRRISEGEKTVHQIQENGGEAIFVSTDVSKAPEVEALVNKTLEVYGHLDYAINNAGVIEPMGSLIERTEEEWHYTVDINLKGAWLSLKYEIRAMLEHGGGAIVNIASIASVIGAPGFSMYSASKGGIIALSRSAALEYAQCGIRINVISPATIKTSMLDSAPPELLAQLIAAHPIGRCGQPEEIAESALWLCSDKASFITGHNLMVDGGYTAQ